MGTTNNISLPQGGGALQGIGEQFSADRHTGTGNLRIPIALPPGRNGFQPQLTLAYSSGSGNGPFGLGWSIGVPRIARKTAKGVPRYRDPSPEVERGDTFVLSGAEDLVDVGPAPHGTAASRRYRPRCEGSFALIDRHRQPDHWEVQSKDGLRSRYGVPSAPGGDAAVIADPSNPDRIFAWLLSETTDTFGNRIEYQYLRDRGRDGRRAWDQLYLAAIRYVDYTHLGERRYLVSVIFDYGQVRDWRADVHDAPPPARPDAFSDHRAGFDVFTRWRCRRILVRTHARRTELIRSYALGYADENPAFASDADASRANGVSLLARVQVTGHAGARTEVLPPLEFDYTRFEPTGRRFQPVEGVDLPADALTRREAELVDLRGSGLPDVLELNGSARWWRNRGDGRFDHPRELSAAPAVALGTPGVQLLDADGDGRPDLVVTQGALSGYYPLRVDEFVPRSFQAYAMAPSFGLNDPNVRLVDLTGDGRTDAVRSGASFECFFQDPGIGWSSPRVVPRRDIADFPDVAFSDPRVKWADMNGDGLQDVVLIQGRAVQYWPSEGHGNWGPRVSMQNAPAGLPRDADLRRLFLHDVDGDGLADLIYVDDGRVLLWMNRCGRRWSEPTIVHGTPPMTDADSVRPIDLFGSGVAGLLWTSGVASRSGSRLRFLDFCGGVKPYLLRGVRNNTGATTQFEYAPSTKFSLAGRPDHERPEWATTLPFPVHLLQRVVVDDHFSGGRLTTQYTYHHGYWDGDDREFRGFGRVDQRDSESFESSDLLHAPPVETRTWFHLGGVAETDRRGRTRHGEADYSSEYWSGDPPALERPEATAALLDRLKQSDPAGNRSALRALRGRVLRREVYALDGSPRATRPVTVSESTFGVREEAAASGHAAGRIFFVFGDANRETQWDRGDDPLTSLTFVDGYDDVGQASSTIEVAVPRGGDFRAAGGAERYLATRRLVTYARRQLPGDAAFIADRIARAETTEIIDRPDVSAPLLRQRILAGVTEQPPRLLELTVNTFDGPAFRGLTLETVGPHGALVRTETLVLTEEVLTAALPGPRPPYLTPAPGVTWTSEYPDNFRRSVPLRAGYVWHDAAEDPRYVTGYYAITGQRRYDFQTQGVEPAFERGRVLAERDALGRETRMAYDLFALLPKRAVDPAGLATLAAYDYRALKVRRIIDPNRNRSYVDYSPLGLPAAVRSGGKRGEAAGDSAARPGVRFEYDFGAFLRQPREPISVQTIRRIHHASAPGAPDEDHDETITTVEYSDGFGRLLQARAQGSTMAFGEALFGGEVLPARQDEIPGDAIGRAAAAGTVPVVVSGAQTYDNKGRVVERFEPFFSTGWTYAPARTSELGRRATIVYDSRGRATQTINPDGSHQRVVFGIPDRLSDPDRFDPTPWVTFTYDENDNAGRTPGAAASAIAHADTPSSSVIDALGRTVLTTVRKGARAEDAYHTRSVYDLRGRLLAVVDALGRTAFRYVYDLAGRTWRVESLDAGVRVTVVDAAGHAVETRDGRGSLILQVHDVLNRPADLWARDTHDAQTTLRHHFEYGDEGRADQAGANRAASRAANRLGRLWRQYDEAGRVEVAAYDFKGNVLQSTRRVVSDDWIRTTFHRAAGSGWRVPRCTVDWAAGTLAEREAVLLDARDYTTSNTYDALNRPRTVVLPADADGARRMLRPGYNRAGALDRVRLEVAGATEAAVDRMVYNAKGQRTLIVYGNGVMTRYAYDADTFRLRRMRTERCERVTADGLAYRIIAPGAPLQDLGYLYDGVGNITATVDRTPGSGTIGDPAAGDARLDEWLRRLLGTGDALVRRFEYDAFYRLTSATGRECASGAATPAAAWDDPRRCGFGSGSHGTPTQDNAPQLTTRYTEQYGYDAAGNLIAIRHVSPTGTAWARTFGIGGRSPDAWEREWAAHLDPDRPWENAPANQLTHVAAAPAPQSYFYDPAGNLVRQNIDRHLTWDHAGRLRAFAVQLLPNDPAQPASEPSIFAHYLYDAAGQRVKKLVRAQGGAWESVTYVGGAFEHRRWVDAAGGLHTNTTVHLLDATQRIAMVRRGERHPDDQLAPVHYHLGDHLGSSAIVVDASGTWLNREEYTPYGETSFGSFARKRYRFTGKERDAESGLSYHAARYYAPWIGRWTACDPIMHPSRGSAYEYVRSNPLAYHDPDGREESSWSNKLFGGLRALGGGLQMVGGAIVFAQVEVPVLAQAAGAVAIAHGLSDWEVGWRQAFSGKTERSAIEQGTSALAEGLGADHQTAQAIGSGVDMGLGFVNPAGPATGLPRLAMAEASSGQRAFAVVVQASTVPARISEASIAVHATTTAMAMSQLSPGGRAGLIRPHGEQPDGRRAAGKASHHPEMQTPEKKAIANYKPDKDWTLLMSVQDHHATFKAQAAQRRGPAFLNELGTAGAIDEAAAIMRQAGVDSATAAEAALEHAGYLFGTTPADRVHMCLPAAP